MNLSETLAQSLENARLGLVQAQKTHDDALARVETLQGRIEAVVVRSAEITARRLSGESTDEEAIELHALDRDQAALEEVLTEAQAAATALAAPLDEARNRLATIESEWARHESETLLAGLREKAVTLETMLVACLQEMARRALAAGHGVMPSVWTPSDRLKDFVNRSDLAVLAGRR